MEKQRDAECAAVAGGALRLDRHAGKEVKIQTAHLELVPKTRDDAEAMLERMTPYERAQVSPDWLARMRASPNVDPWVHGFSAVHRDSGAVVGTGGFKGPPAD